MTDPTIEDSCSTVSTVASVFSQRRVARQIENNSIEVTLDVAILKRAARRKLKKFYNHLLF
jgi:glycerol dehydrogenase-like iron-containing ADH family enzyme